MLQDLKQSQCDQSSESQGESVMECGYDKQALDMHPKTYKALYWSLCIS